MYTPALAAILAGTAVLAYNKSRRPHNPCSKDSISALLTGGHNFAKAELQIGLTRIFRQFEIELFDVVREQDIDHTWALNSREPDMKGV